MGNNSDRWKAMLSSNFRTLVGRSDSATSTFVKTFLSFLLKEGRRLILLPQPSQVILARQQGTYAAFLIAFILTSLSLKAEHTRDKLYLLTPVTTLVSNQHQPTSGLKKQNLGQRSFLSNFRSAKKIIGWKILVFCCFGKKSWQGRTESRDELQILFFAGKRFEGLIFYSYCWKSATLGLVLFLYFLTFLFPESSRAS